MRRPRTSYRSSNGVSQPYETLFLQTSETGWMLRSFAVIDLFTIFIDCAVLVIVIVTTIPSYCLKL